MWNVHEFHSQLHKLSLIVSLINFASSQIENIAADYKIGDLCTKCIIKI